MTASEGGPTGPLQHLDAVQQAVEALPPFPESASVDALLDETDAALTELKAAYHRPTQTGAEAPRRGGILSRFRRKSKA
ncbi:MAG TPA: hypothetical protein VFB34_11760 [Chloroflexota bacterium]|nr:hypothetical protein [Chloroflexota bacterium]